MFFNLFQVAEPQKFIIIWRILNVQKNAIYSIFREPCKELAEPSLKTLLYVQGEGE